MRRPAFSIAGMMSIVVVAAVDCVALRVLLGEPRPSIFGFLGLLGAIPTLNVLVIGGLLLLQCRVWQKPSSPFLNGFEAIGSAALLVYVAACWYGPWLLLSGLEAVRTSAFGGTEIAPPRLNSPGQVATLLSSAMLCFVIPQIVVAIAGGIVASKRAAWRPAT